MFWTHRNFSHKQMTHQRDFHSIHYSDGGTTLRQNYSKQLVLQKLSENKQKTRD